LAKRRILLVDDEVTVLLTLKTVLEISGFDVDTATSAHEGKLRIKRNEYQMVITDMRMESDASGREVIQAARTAAYHPAVALLTAYPEDDYGDGAADKMLVKPMQTKVLIQQIERLMDTHAAKLQRLATASAPEPRTPAKKAPAKATKKAVAKKAPARKPIPKTAAKRKTRR
jgi:DNA-binding response OmpR family regulator